MRILYISDSLLTGDFVLRLQSEGHEMRLYIAEEQLRGCYDGLVEKTTDWKADLSWVGKDGLILFDDVGFGGEQNKLRLEGYTVIGGSELAEKLECDRAYAQSMFKKAGLPCLETHDFETAAETISFVEQHPDTWVIKYSNGHWMKTFAYLGEKPDGSDVVAVLQNYAKHRINHSERITLQKRVYGVEIGVGRYFNGTDWVGPIEYNVEHTHLFPGNIGPIVDEMGTVAWMRENESEKLYANTLAKMTDILRAADFRGDFDIGCIVNENGIFPLEATARFGVPAIHLQDTLHETDWGSFLYGIARGESPASTWLTDYGVVISVVLPPFPYTHDEVGRAMLGTQVHIRNHEYKSLHKNVHFDEVASLDGTFDTLYIAGGNGYAYYATGTGKTIIEANQNALAVIDDVYVSRMFYRSDIGHEFATNGLPQLQSWGYLK